LDLISIIWIGGIFFTIAIQKYSKVFTDDFRDKAAA
jgi:hypothetical protein|tara:strand:+ start:24 stop:131 length:108 start_codon:yes stop_codon:yes gene_type:complete